MAAAPAASNRYTAGRPVVLGLAKLLVLTLGQLPGSSAVPVAHNFQPHETEGKHPDDPSLWLYLGIAAFLVLSGGAFAGLTIALMGQVRKARAPYLLMSRQQTQRHCADVGKANANASR